jgi:hypothetical protein
MDNADNTHPAAIVFYLDDDVVNVNTCELTFSLKKFRAYSKATESGGSSTQTSSAGGGTTATSSAGGGTSTSTSSGGGTTATSTTQIFESNMIQTLGPEHISSNYHDHSVTIPGADFNHSHGVTIDNHSHDVTIEDHTHDVVIEDHTHNVDIPAHVHDVKQGIYELDSIPDNVSITVDGNHVSFTGNSSERLSLVDYLSKDSSGKIVRGKHTVEILPADLARIEAFIMLRVFISSHLGGTY